MNAIAAARRPRLSALPDADIRPAGQIDRAPVGVEALKALQKVDVVLRAEDFDVEGALRGSPLEQGLKNSDDLRLPPPPSPPLSGSALLRATQRSIKNFRAQAEVPSGGDAKALVAEAKMMSLLEGIDRLKLDIMARAHQRHLT